MFMVELSYHTIKKEIEDLDHKSKKKDIALKDSSNQLEDDHLKLIKFIEQDNIITQEKDKEAEKMCANRKLREAKIKKIDTKVINLKSEIDKNKDLMTGLEDHKKFLLALSPNQWVADEEARKKSKYERVKKEWIDFHRKNTRDDHIIFREDDEFYSQEQKTQTGSLPAGGAMAAINAAKGKGK